MTLLATVVVVLVLAGAPASFAQTIPPVPSLPAQAAPPAQSAPSQPTFKTGTELVALNVTVTDPKQQYVAGLHEADFAVYEDGVKQDLSFFAASQIPIDLIILLDTSASMQEKMPLAKAAAAGFLRTLRDGDRAAVVAFNDNVRVLQGLTEDRAALGAALDQLAPAGATAMHNAIYIALREFGHAAKQAGEVRRQAIAVFSDGDDTASMMSFEDVLEQAKRTGVNVYTIALQAPSAIAKRAGARRYFSQSDYALKTLAQETGAQSFFPERMQELPDVYARIATELGAQYSLAYAPKNARKDGRFRRVVVQVLSRPDVRPRTRSGYFADLLRAPLALIKAIRDPQ